MKLCRIILFKHLERGDVHTQLVTRNVSWSCYHLPHPPIKQHTIHMMQKNIKEL